MTDLFELKPRLNDEFDWEPMPDGCLLYCRESGQILTVNASAELALSYCDGETTVRQALRELEEEGAPVSEKDFENAIQRFIDEKVLLVGEPTTEVKS